MEVFLGIDGGSTSTKAVCLSRSGDVLASSYRLSQGDPVADAIAVLQQLRQHFAQSNARMEILGSATTGYSRDLLQRVFHADAALVETVAHANSALRVCPDVDAIIDVGGQDIKIICLNHGAVKDFRLNTQCSAGNGYFLQAAAESLGIAIEDFAGVAFTARQMPVFSYGCAVFLQSDIVNFQRQGWQPQEIIAGLAAVLPKNVFLYVAGSLQHRHPRTPLPPAGRHAAQPRRGQSRGGLHAQPLFRRGRAGDLRASPLRRGRSHRRRTARPGAARAGPPQQLHRTWTSLDQIRYSTVRNEETRCGFCNNRCARTFIEVSDAAQARPGRRPRPTTCRPTAPTHLRPRAASSWPVASGEKPPTRRPRASSTPPSPPSSSRIPTFPPWRPGAAFQPQQVHGVASAPARAALLPSSRRRAKQRKQRPALRIGIPKVLNLYAYGPLFSAYFASLGLPAENIVFSDTTTQEQYRSTLGLAAVDPCFPSKVCISHVRNLLEKSSRRKLDLIFFPMIDTLTTTLEDCRGSNACPAGAATPEAVQSAFSLSRNLFEEHNITYVHPLVNLADRELFALQMFECWKDILGLDWQENARAIDAAYAAQQRYENGLRERIAPDSWTSLRVNGRSAWLCSDAPIITIRA